jgi:hypothetical protein
MNERLPANRRAACLMHLVLPGTAAPSPDVSVPVHGFMHKSGLFACKGTQRTAVVVNRQSDFS